MATTLDELTRADAGRVGGKAWNCARLKQAGFPVPDGLVVPCDASHAEIGSIDRDPWFDRHPAGERYAIRSSGLAEDAPEQSFAGIHETRLNVARGDVREAVSTCRASTDSDRARAYRRARSLPADATAAGVLIQRMVRPTASGVAFTLDPLTGDRDVIVINAAPGLGTAVVDGQIDPDEIRIRKYDRHVLSYRAGMSAGVGDGLQAVPPALPQAVLNDLASLLIAIEDHYGSPQDIEWCHDGRQIWIVQSRPITVDPHSPAEVEWTRANLAEVLPELTSPQALDVFERMLNAAQRRHFGRLIASEDELGPMTKPFYGRLYFNFSQLRHVCWMTASPVADVMRSLGHPDEIRPEDTVARRPPLQAIRVVPDLLRLLSQHLRVASLMRAHEARVAALTQKLAAADPLTMPDERIWATLTDWQRTGTEWLGIVLVFGGVMLFEVQLRKICEAVDVSFERLLHSHLAAGERSVSGQQAFDLVALADIARADPRVVAWLSSPDGAAMGDALRGTAFLTRFDEFLDRYGHRGLYESDWSLPRSSEDPAPLLQAIRLRLSHDGGEDADTVAARAAADASTAWRELEQRMTGARRWILLPRARRLLATIKRYYVLREQVRSDMVRVLAVMRRWHLVLADRFVERGWLSNRADYFLLQSGEIADMIADPSRPEGHNALRQIAAARAADLERYRRLEMPLLMRESELPRLIRAAQVSDAGWDGGELRGVPVSCGSVEADVVVLDNPGDFGRMKRGAILVTRATDPSWTPIFTLAAGVIVEVGGVLSHASTVAREYGIPALANVRQATRRLRTGDRVELNATEGYVKKL